MSQPSLNQFFFVYLSSSFMSLYVFRPTLRALITRLQCKLNEKKNPSMRKTKKYEWSSMENPQCFDAASAMFCGYTVKRHIAPHCFLMFHPHFSRNWRVFYHHQLHYVEKKEKTTFLCAKRDILLPLPGVFTVWRDILCTLGLRPWKFMVIHFSEEVKFHCIFHLQRKSQ